MRVLVTGGTGAVGRFVVAEVAAAGHEVISASRQPSTGGEEWVRFEAGTDEFGTLLARSGADRVIHLAAMVGAQCEHDPVKAIGVNGTAVIELLAAARAARTGRVVLMSSKAAYGDLPQPRDADDARLESELPVRPVSAYGMSKAVAEWAAADAVRRYGQDVVVIRAATTVGPGKGAQHGPTAAPSRLIEGAVAGVPVTLEEGGDQIDDFIYNKDLARGLVAAALAPERLPNLYYQLSSGRGATLTELAEHLRARFPQSRITVGGGGNFHRLDHNLHCVLSYQLARDDFGYVPRYPFPAWVDDYIAVVRAEAGQTGG